MVGLFGLCWMANLDIRSGAREEEVEIQSKDALR